MEKRNYVKPAIEFQGINPTTSFMAVSDIVIEGGETDTEVACAYVNYVYEKDDEEILNLKSAIKRDIEAINFVKKMAQKFSMAKKNLEKIKQGQSIKV